MDVKTEKIVETYIKVRDAISEMEAKHKQEKKSLQEQIDILEKALLERCEEAGGNISIPHVASITRRVSRNYWTNDWESLYRIVKEHDAFHLLHQRISNKAMQEFLEEHPDLLPEGMNVDSRYAVTVTRRS
jgi:acetyl-CoA carboxylase alpha subunit